MSRFPVNPLVIWRFDSTNSAGSLLLVRDNRSVAAVGPHVQYQDFRVINADLLYCGMDCEVLD